LIKFISLLNPNLLWLLFLIIRLQFYSLNIFKFFVISFVRVNHVKLLHCRIFSSKVALFIYFILCLLFRYFLKFINQTFHFVKFRCLFCIYSLFFNFPFRIEHPYVIILIRKFSCCHYFQKLVNLLLEVGFYVFPHFDVFLLGPGNDAFFHLRGNC